MFSCEFCEILKKILSRGIPPVAAPKKRSQYLQKKVKIPIKKIKTEKPKQTTVKLKKIYFTYCFFKILSVLLLASNHQCTYLMQETMFVKYISQYYILGFLNTGFPQNK